MRLLLIDDDCDFLDSVLREAEKEYTVDVAYSGTVGANLSQSNEYDVIVVKSNLPDMEGLDLCKIAREENVTSPILYVSDEFNVNKKINCLNSGVDSFISRPINKDELFAEVRALARRRSVNLAGAQIKFENLTLNTRNRTVTINENKISLRRKEYDILEYMLLHRGRFISKEELLEHIWREGLYVLSNTIEVHMRSLRKKIDGPFGRPLIVTSRGNGYIIEC